MICGWQIFMRLKTRLVLDPYRVKIKPPVQLVVLIGIVNCVIIHAASTEERNVVKRFASGSGYCPPFMLKRV